MFAQRLSAFMARRNLHYGWVVVAVTFVTLLMTAGAMLSILGIVGSTTLTGPRYLFALAGDGYGPRWLARVHPRFHTPALAILVQTAVVLVLAWSGSFVELATLSVVARLATYLGTAAAVPVLRRRLRGRPGALRLPFGDAIPLAALAVSIGLLTGARGADLAMGAAALGVGALIYRLGRTERAGAAPRRR